jgi:hypothetical protein
MLALGAVNLLVLEPRLRRAASSGMRIGRTIATEAGLGIVVFLLAGLLTSLPTARGELEQQASGHVFHLSADGISGHLAISPGTVGFNRYTLDLSIDEDDLPADGTVLMHLTSTGELAGIQEVELARSGPQRFEATGSELSVPQTWEIEIILRRPSEDDWVAGTDLELGDDAATANADVPDPAPRFTGLAGGISVVALAAALPLLVVAWRTWRSKALLAAAALIALLSLAGLATAYRSVDSTAAQPASGEHHHEH